MFKGHAEATTKRFGGKGGDKTEFEGVREEGIGIQMVAVKKESEIIEFPIPLPRSAGPWSNVEGGKPWDDGVFSKVKEVNLHICLVNNIDIICGVQFLYERRDGRDVLSTWHGSCHGKIKQLKLDEDDFLVGVEGFYGPIEGVDTIKSLKFYTKKKAWGPFGREVGKYFNSDMGSKGMVVGFYGSSGAHLNAIGVHTEYF
ncbi:Jacalin-related lectin 3 [Striga hermonthica]|uniref:Jacalin-related lectin 3 n=1 Tax=Striga hermonthica TaxID=68872 RepID=A0A9N7R4N7_STRHE|nr:Jacalin-related lectin 3 [Striga hermonthica]